MLCMQQCIDLCDFTPEEAETLRDHVTLAEIVAIQAECPRNKAAAGDADTDGPPGCEMRDIRDQLREELWAADDFDDLERVLDRYCAYAEARDGGGADAG